MGILAGERGRYVFSFFGEIEVRGAGGIVVEPDVGIQMPPSPLKPCQSHVGTPSGPPVKRLTSPLYVRTQFQPKGCSLHLSQTAVLFGLCAATVCGMCRFGMGLESGSRAARGGGRGGLSRGGFFPMNSS